MDIKKQKLSDFLNSILEHEVFGVQIRVIRTSLGLSAQDIVDEFFRYNLNVQSLEGNEVYESIANRFVLHIHNLINGSWHIKRQKVTSDLISMANPRHMADVGFGVPSKYVYDLVIRENKFNVTLVDKYDSAFVFAKHLLNHWDANWETKIFFSKRDMDKSEYIGDYDLYLFQDAIEHTQDPTSYLRKHINLSPKDAKFIISLPIGSIFPRHYMAWETQEVGERWLETCGLRIEAQEKIFVNPDVDLFSEQIDSNYHDLYAFCAKAA